MCWKKKKKKKEPPDKLRIRGVMRLSCVCVSAGARLMESTADGERELWRARLSDDGWMCAYIVALSFCCVPALVFFLVLLLLVVLVPSEEELKKSVDVLFVCVFGRKTLLSIKGLGPCSSISPEVIMNL